MLKRLGFIFVVLAFILFFSQFLLPVAIADILGDAMATATRAEKTDAQVEKMPALMMLGGSFDHVRVHAEAAKTDKITFDRFDVEMKQVKVDMYSLVRTRKLEDVSAQSVKVEAVVSENELARAINKSVKGAKDAKVTITPEKVSAEGMVSIGGVVNAKVRLEGKIISQDGKIVLKTENFQINHGIVGKLGGKMLTDLVLVDLMDLPFHVTVKNIILEQGRAVIHADNR